VLGALDLLRPQVFESEQLLEILQEYFELLSNHTTYNKQYVSLVGKFVDFLCHYVVACSDTALITKHTKLLLETQLVYQDIKKIRFLVDMVSDRNANIHTLTSPQPPPLAREQVDALRVQMDIDETDNTDIISGNFRPTFVSALEVLVEVDKTSLRYPTVLLYFCDDFLRLLWCRDVSVRQLAYKLLHRYVQNQPQDADRVLLIYLKTLDSNDPGVVRSAIEHAPDLFHFAIDQSEYFLQRLFVQGGKSAGNELRKIIQSFLSFRIR